MESKGDSKFDPSESSAVAAAKTFTLEKEQELRFETDGDSKVVVKLLKGTAEVFGTELAPGREYIFHHAKAAVFTWHGCELQISGPTAVCYKAEETPMVTYINAHAAIDTLRKKAKANNITGPVTMIVGPGDVGKSSVCRILLSYAVRAGWKPLFVDLDVGQNAITIPGAIAATVVEHPAGVENTEGIQAKAPLLYYFGHTTPQQSVQLYDKLMERLAYWVHQRVNNVESSRFAGVIINTCGWVEGQGYELLVKAAVHFQVDVILVVGDDKLHSSLKADATLQERKTTVAALPKSGGVVNRNANFRKISRDRAIREYFHGPHNDLYPQSLTFPFTALQLYRVGGGPQAPSEALPIGKKRLLDPNRVEPVRWSAELKNSVVAVSYAEDESKILEANVAGFLWITNVDMQKQTVTLLSPAPAPLPNKILLTGSLKFYE